MARTLTKHAATAQAIRTTLKAAYPTVSFKVRSSSFSMGNSVEIDWTDGPTYDQVDALVRQYQCGHFDGMIDLYEYSNRRDDIPQAKYMQVQRHMSDGARRAMVDYLNRYWGYTLRLIERSYSDRTWLDIDHTSDAPRGNGSGWQSDDIHREFHTLSLLCRSCGSATLPGDTSCPMCGHELAAKEEAT